MSKYRVGDRVMMIGTINAVGDGAIDGFYGVEVAGEGVVGYREESLSPAPFTPTGKTVKVRAAVGVREDGQWSVVGWSEGDGKPIPDDDIMESGALEEYDTYHWITAEVPVPEPQTIPGTVETSDA